MNTQTQSFTRWFFNTCMTILFIICMPIAMIKCAYVAADDFIGCVIKGDYL